jgi:hypothetical protein
MSLPIIAKTNKNNYHVRRIALTYLALLISTRFVSSESSFELVKEQHSRTTSSRTNHYDGSGILSQEQMYQSNSCWSEVFDDLHRMKDHAVLDGGTRLPLSGVELKEIDACFFFTRDHRRLLALKITNCHMRESGRPPLSDNCSSSVVLKGEDPAEKLTATCMSKLEWQTYTHFYLSVESICSHLQKESITKKLFDLSTSTTLSEKSFEERIVSALNNLSALQTSRLGRDTKIQKSREDQILAQKMFESSIETFFGDFLTSISAHMNKLGNPSVTQQLDYELQKVIKNAYFHLRHASFTCISWQMASIKFVVATFFLLFLTKFKSMEYTRRKLVQLTVAQLLIELSLSSFRMCIEDEQVIVLWWQCTNIGWLAVTTVILLVAGLFKSAAGKGIQATELLDSKVVQNNMERIIDLQKRENERMIHTIIHLLGTTTSNHHERNKVWRKEN